MENKIEQLIYNIEESFNKLNTSVEQLQKAENIASKSVDTTSSLITEFQSSIQSIEQLVKVDFANEYNKLLDTNNELLDKLGKIDFDTKFCDVNTAIKEINFDGKFQSVEQKIIDINFDDKFQSVEQRIIDKNFDIKFSELNTAVKEINFDDKFQSVEQKISDQMKEVSQLKTLIYIVIILIVLSSLAVLILTK